MGGLIWVLVVVGSIIARVVKQSRDTKAGRRPPPTSTTPTASGDELRDFLEKLSGNTPPAPRPAVISSPPVVVRTPPPVRATPPRVSHKAPPPVQPTPPPIATPPAPMPAMPTVEHTVEALKPRSRPAIDASELSGLLRKTRKASQRAIVLADILGKPLAMRESPSAL